MQREISSIALWNPVASIVFSSSLLPIQSTQTSLPKEVGNSDTNFSGNGNNSNFLNIITDFSIAVDGGNQYRPMLVYKPAAEYRLIDMHSSMNLNKIDIIVYWKRHLWQTPPVRAPSWLRRQCEDLVQKKRL